MGPWPSEIVLRVELPGVDPDSIDVTVRDTTLRVRAERQAPTAEQGEYLRRGFSPRADGQAKHEWAPGQPGAPSPQ
jgi:Hsp20/alpha crystallin family protein